MKIAIVTRQMIIGGVEKALLPMLRVLNSDNEIELYVEKLGGELLEELPDEVRLIEIPRKAQNQLKPILFRKIEMFLVRIRLFFCRKYVKQCELSVYRFPKIEKNYDLAIAYHAPNTIPVFYTINNLKAKKKVLWLHGDVETNHMTGRLAKHYYKQYDKVFAVSKQSKDIFDKHFPELSQYCEVFYNLIEVEYVYQQAEKGPTYNDNFEGTRILTIGRLDYQKGIDIAIEVCKKLIDAGMSVRWYVCGEGQERETLENIISEYKMDEHFLLLGNCKNPYRFLKDCDIYVQPSRTEGFCTATNEARVFAKPVVVTDVCGMREQFVNEETGIICNISVESIFENIMRMLKEPDLCKKLSNNVKIDDSKTNIECLYQIIKSI